MKASRPRSTLRLPNDGARNSIWPPPPPSDFCSSRAVGFAKFWTLNGAMWISSAECRSCGRAKPAGSRSPDAPPSRFWKACRAPACSSSLATLPSKPRSDLKWPWQAVANHAGLEGFRIHDLRHSFASIGAGTGMGLPIVGSSSGMSTAHNGSLRAFGRRSASPRFRGHRGDARGGHGRTLSVTVAPLPTVSEGRLRVRCVRRRPALPVEPAAVCCTVGGARLGACLATVLGVSSGEVRNAERWETAGARSETGVHKPRVGLSASGIGQECLRVQRVLVAEQNGVLGPANWIALDKLLVDAQRCGWPTAQAFNGILEKIRSSFVGCRKNIEETCIPGGRAR